ncbi:hypothetical protein BIW11_06171, partial [Tropilaelaps mercedesae]
DADALFDDNLLNKATHREGVRGSGSEAAMERTYTGKVFSLGDDTGYVVVGDTYYKFKATDLVRGDNLTCLSDRLCPNDDVEVLIVVPQGIWLVGKYIVGARSTIRSREVYASLRFECTSKIVSPKSAIEGSPSAATAGILRPSATRRRFNLLSYPIPPPFELQGRSYARPIPRGRALAPRSASSGRPSTVVHPSGPPPAVPNQLGEVRQATPSARSQRRDPRIARLIPASYANDNDYVSYGADSMELGSDLANCYLGGYYPSLAIRREQVRNARTAAAAAADPETIDNVRRRQTNIDWSDPLFRLITIVDRPSNMLN